jgi:hypothetical protein
MANYARILLIAAFAAITSCAAGDAKDIETWTTSVLDPWLKGELPGKLAPARSGEKIGPAALISTGPQESNSCITIRFDRRQFSEQFLSQLLASSSGSNFAPFTSNGVEVVVGEESVFLNVYPGVVLLLRPDLVYPSQTRAFVDMQPVGRVEWVAGNVAIDKHVSNLAKFGNFVIAPVSKAVSIARGDVTVQKDGSIAGSGRPASQADLPKKFPPRRITQNDKSIRCAV